MTHVCFVPVAKSPLGRTWFGTVFSLQAYNIGPFRLIALKNACLRKWCLRHRRLLVSMVVLKCWLQLQLHLLPCSRYLHLGWLQLMVQLWIPWLLGVFTFLVWTLVLLWGFMERTRLLSVLRLKPFMWYFFACVDYGMKVFSNRSHWSLLPIVPLPFPWFILCMGFPLFWVENFDHCNSFVNVEVCKLFSSGCRLMDVTWPVGNLFIFLKWS